MRGRARRPQRTRTVTTLARALYRYTKDRQKLFQRIRYAPLRLPATLTPEACDVLTRLLDRDPLARLGARPGPEGAAEVEAHPFFNEVRYSSNARGLPRDSEGTLLSYRRATRRSISRGSRRATSRSSRPSGRSRPSLRTK